MSLGIREKFQQRKISSIIKLQAGAAAETVFNKHYEGINPPFRFNATAPPPGVSPEEFADRIGSRTIELLARKMPEVAVEYDPSASRSATHEFDSLTSEVTHPTQRDDVILVFAGKTALS